MEKGGKTINNVIMFYTDGYYSRNKSLYIKSVEVEISINLENHLMPEGRSVGCTGNAQS